jgi:ribose transport system ATP-binding protein
METRTGLSENSVLEMKSITKRFPGVLALDGVDFHCQKGSVHALVGENGAGKSTLMKILAGAYQPDGGEIVLRGRKTKIRDPRNALQLGISVIYQESNLVPYLDAAQNIFLGKEPRGRLGRLKTQEIYKQAGELVSRLGASIDLKRPVNLVSVAHRQIIEIAKSLSYDAQILVMDEPTSSLPLEEVERLFSMVRSLKEHGVAIIYISHRLEEIFEIADTITVLKDGKKVGSLNATEATKTNLIEMMVGRPLSDAFPPRSSRPAQEEALRVVDLTRAPFLDGVSFTLGSGEIVGVTGLDGSGRRELGRAISGDDPPERGEVYFFGKRISCKSPRITINAGLAFMSDDRKSEGLVMGLSLLENISLPSLGNRLRGFAINRVREKKEVTMAAESVRLDSAFLKREAQYLSGGTQQKGVLAKWLLMNARLIVLDEPTRGIDVGTKVEIYHLMRELADRGTAILMLSSELPEIIGMSDRVLVMYQGRIAREFKGGEPTEKDILSAAMMGTGKHEEH